MSSGFYRAFEDHHRGSRELILGRLEVYLPFIETLKAWHTPCTALDLGCGRGEWLQLLQNNGVQARGVDLDEGMLQACHELNLQAEQGDAIAALQALPDNSLSVVSGFHIVEHIEFSQVQQIAEEALRVLKPGGLLILETPNAENLVVGTHNFYLDPTHIRPVPHILLAFVTELSGFARNKVLRLQEDPAIYQMQRPGLIQVLAGVSPDYAVVAQKPATDELMQDFDPMFAVEYGISINHIAERYEQALQTELNEIKHRMEELAQKEQRLRDTLVEAAERVMAIGQNNQNLTPELYKAELRAVQLETLTEQLRQQLLQATQRLYQEEARTRQEENRARKAETELREIITRTAQLEARYEIAQNQQQLQNEQQNQLNQQLVAQTQRIQELQYQLHISEKKSAETAEEIALFKSTIAEQEQQLKDASQVLAETSSQNEGLKKQLSNAAEEIAELSDQLAEATDCIAQLKNQAETDAEDWAKQLTEKLAEQATALEAQFAEQLNSTTEQFNQQLEQTTQQLNESLGNAHNWYVRATELEADLNSTKDELHNVHQANHQHWTQLQESLGNAHHWYLRATEAEQHHAAAQQRINDLLHSTSWKITAPLRGLRRLIAWLLALPVRAIKALLRPLLSRVIRFALNRPEVRTRWANRLRKYPKVFAHLRQFAINRGLVVEPPMPTHASVQVSAPVQTPATPVATAAEQAQPTANESPNLDSLTPRAKQIYHDLKAAIEKNKEHQ
ncbi:methyltransferase domain-containing protein [Pseudomonas wenzhouensis]|nr:methyltransferase domain-containing protein [Pseudomonas wenzhouensis]MDM9652747.1 methyltransferase domain-containing protein [Pseudomonas wenzhouensis]